MLYWKAAKSGKVTKITIRESTDSKKSIEEKHTALLKTEEDRIISKCSFSRLLIKVLDLFREKFFSAARRIHRSLLNSLPSYSDILYL